MRTNCAAGMATIIACLFTASMSRADPVEYSTITIPEHEVELRSLLTTYEFLMGEEKFSEAYEHVEIALLSAKHSRVRHALLGSLKKVASTSTELAKRGVELIDLLASHYAHEEALVAKSVQGQLLTRLGEFGRAEEVLREVVTANPSDPHALWGAHYRIGYNYYQAKDHKKAIEQFQWMLDNLEMSESDRRQTAMQLVSSAVIIGSPEEQIRVIENILQENDVPPRSHMMWLEYLHPAYLQVGEHEKLKISLEQYLMLHQFVFGDSPGESRREKAEAVLQKLN